MTEYKSLMLSDFILSLRFTAFLLVITVIQAGLIERFGITSLNIKPNLHQLRRHMKPSGQPILTNQPLMVRTMRKDFMI